MSEELRYVEGPLQLNSLPRGALTPNGGRLSDEGQRRVRLGLIARWSGLVAYGNHAPGGSLGVLSLIAKRRHLVLSLAPTSHIAERATAQFQAMKTRMTGSSIEEEET
jgi:hypothetical protein